MKQYINIDEEAISPFIKDFITIWKQKKRYSKDPILTLGQIIELNLATTSTFYKEDSDGRFFNNSLQSDESVISWDGIELIDIQFFQALTNIKHRLASGRTFNENYSESE